MKKLLSYIIIFFFSSLSFSFSESISDFQIEGISVDDSVLDYFTEKTLKKTSKKKMKTRSGSTHGFNGPSTDSYGETEASETIKETSIPNKNLETYDDVKVTYFSETNTIRNVTGIKYFEKNSCNGKQKEAFNDLNKILEGSYKLDKRSVAADIQLVQYTFDLENGGSIEIGCYDKSKTDNTEWVSALMLTINSKGIKKTVNTTPSTGQQTNSKFIQLKPTQGKIEGRIKF
jgi:hypothetical protein